MTTSLMHVSTLCSSPLRVTTRLLCALAVVGATTGCGRDSPAAPGAVPISPPPAGHRFVVTANGVSPSLVEIRVGDRVVFANHDQVDHDMSSDDHPLHLNCPAINQIGYLRPGDTRESGNFVNAETCTFHDHLNAANQSLRGAIVVVE